MTQRTNTPYHILIPLADNQWHNVTQTISDRANELGLDVDAFYFVGFSSPAKFDFKVSFEVMKDDKAFPVSGLDEWDNGDKAFQILKNKIMCKASPLAGDNISLYITEDKSFYG